MDLRQAAPGWGNKRKAESMPGKYCSTMMRPGSCPQDGGAYEKVDAKTATAPAAATPARQQVGDVFLDYLNEWVQVHKASIQPATFISYNG